MVWAYPALFVLLICLLLYGSLVIRQIMPKNQRQSWSGIPSKLVYFSALQRNCINAWCSHYLMLPCIWPSVICMRYYRQTILLLLSICLDHSGLYTERTYWTFWWALSYRHCLCLFWIFKYLPFACLLFLTLWLLLICCSENWKLLV